MHVFNLSNDTGEFVNAHSWRFKLRSIPSIDAVAHVTFIEALKFSSLLVINMYGFCIQTLIGQVAIQLKHAGVDACQHEVRAGGHVPYWRDAIYG